MPIPAFTTRFVLGGSLPGGERWQSGFWINKNATDLAQVNDWAAYCYAAFTNDVSGHFMYTWKRALNNAQTTFDAVNVYSYADTSGHASLVGAAAGTVYLGTATGNRLTDQVSLCVTTRTDYAGASHRGRMYIPATGATLDTNTLFSSTDVMALLTGLYADMKLVEVHTGGFQSVVVSNHLGTYATITKLTADQRPDIQRRRANRQGRGITQTVAFTRP